MAIRTYYRDRLEDSRSYGAASELPAPPPLPPVTPRPDLEESPLLYGAPPTRSGNGMPGAFDGRPRVQLSRIECEAARFAGISLGEYAQAKLRMIEAKKADPDKYGVFDGR